MPFTSVSQASVFSLRIFEVALKFDLDAHQVAPGVPLFLQVVGEDGEVDGRVGSEVGREVALFEGDGLGLEPDLHGAGVVAVEGEGDVEGALDGVPVSVGDSEAQLSGLPGLVLGLVGFDIDFEVIAAGDNHLAGIADHVAIPANNVSIQRQRTIELMVQRNRHGRFAFFKLQGMREDGLPVFDDIEENRFRLILRRQLVSFDRKKMPYSQWSPSPSADVWRTVRLLKPIARSVGKSSRSLKGWFDLILLTGLR